MPGAQASSSLAGTHVWIISSTKALAMSEFQHIYFKLTRFRSIHNCSNTRTSASGGKLKYTSSFRRTYNTYLAKYEDKLVTKSGGTAKDIQFLQWEIALKFLS